MKTLLTLLFISASFMVIAQTSDSAQFYFKQAQEYKLEKRYLIASKSFEKAIQLDPSNINFLMENGFVNLEMRKTDAAISNFTKIYQLQPDNKVAIRQLMDLYYNYRQYNKAIEFGGKCVDCDGAQRIIGMSLYQQEDYAKAQKYLLAAISKDPQDKDATYTMARTFLDMEEYKKAVPYYEKAVSLDKNNYTRMYELGLLYFNLSDYKSAVTSFTEAAARGYVVNNDYKENLGYAKLYTGDYDNGEQLLMSVWEKKPGNKDLLRDMSEVLYQQKQYERSLVYCQRLMQLDANDAKALYQAGLNFQKKGNTDRGQQMCDKAITMDPSLASLRQEKKMPGM